MCHLKVIIGSFLEGYPYLYWPFVSRIAEKAMTLSVFYHSNAWTVRVDPIAPKCQQSKSILLRSILCEYQWHRGHSVFAWNSCSIKRNRVRVDIRVRLKKIELDYPETGKHPGKSGIFFNFSFITLVKRHGSLIEVWRLVYAAFSRHFTRNITST